MIYLLVVIYVLALLYGLKIFNYRDNNKPTYARWKYHIVNNCVSCCSCHVTLEMKFFILLVIEGLFMHLLQKMFGDIGILLAMYRILNIKG